jgi:hypothetical protein
MFISFMEVLGGFFDRRFILAYWAPAFIAASLLGGVLLLGLGWQRTLNWWAGISTLEVTILGVGALVAITVLAYLLQAMTATVIRLYEGYGWGNRVANWARSEQRRAWRELKQTSSYGDSDGALKAIHQPGSYSKLYFNFPRDPAFLRPTRLGNTLTAAEEYSFQVYGLDSILWWPRLVVLLPGPFRAQVDDALVPMVTLLNLSAMLNLLAIIGGGLLILIGGQWFLFAAVFLGAFVLAWLCYQAAVGQAASYGSLIRVAFDLYRHEILKQMHIPVPDDLIKERVLWSGLNQWIFRYIPPWESIQESKQPPVPIQLSELPTDYPFYYDSHGMLPPEQLEVTLKSTPE